MNRFVRWLLVGCLGAGAPLVWAAPDWVAVVPAAEPSLTNTSGQLVDGRGALLTDRLGQPLVPKCATPQVPGTGADNPFRFFVQPGDPARLLVLHTGGGACWNGVTCASSLGGGRGTYSASVSETPQSLKFAGGLLDADAPANPFAGWTKVYIPYCTGDIGWGNQDTNYGVPVPGGGVFPFQIAHRGYANIRAVTRWLEQRFQAGGKPSKVLVSGISAGGYAAIGTLFPEVAAVAGRHASYSVIGDSANGVVTDAFLQSARANWRFDATVPGHVLKALDQGAAGLSARVYTSLAQAHRQVRFAQYQNAFDLIQAQVLNIMKNPENPALWEDPAAVGQALQEWTVAMRWNTLLTAAQPGYRFYTAAGYEHGMVLDIPREAGQGFCTDHFSTESSARSLGGTVALRSWANDMVNRPGIGWLTGQWKNASCAPHCNVPPICPP